MLPVVLLLPVIAALASVVAGARHAPRIALITMLIGLAVVATIACDVLVGGATLEYVIGGWAPPLGLRLRVDGLSAAMMLTTAVVMLATGIYARADFSSPQDEAESRRAYAFWPLLLGLWGAMNAVFLGHDLFNLFVALELLTFVAVPLVCLDGKAETLQAALRYLLFALLGSAMYLLGAALLYGAYGTLDITQLAARVQGGPSTWAAAALMTTGLLAKTAVVPLHLWLPPAHAGAPPAASTVLSALVVKGSFFILVRLWFEVMPALAPAAAMQLLAALGAVAIVLGSGVALRQARLKLMIAYSTIAQIGYLMLMFALACDPGTGLHAGAALTGGLLQAVSHAFAKAAMFMTAGLMAGMLGHDRIGEMAGIGRAMPLGVLAFALAGVSLIGLPPSGGFLAKWLLLGAAVETGQWWWAVVIVAGGLLTATYVLLVLVRMSGGGEGSFEVRKPAARHRQLVALALACTAAVLGLLALGPVELPAFDADTPMQVAGR